MSAVLVVLLLADAFLCPLDVLVRRAAGYTARGAGQLCVNVLDVGEGDCILIEFPDGKTLLMDGGDGSAEHLASVYSFLDARGIRSLGDVMATHADADHVGGLASIVARYGAERVFVPQTEKSLLADNTAYARFYAAAQASGAEFVLSQNFRTTLSGDRDEFYYWMILSPRSPLIEGSEYGRTDEDARNDVSAVVYLEYAGRRFLFMGDAGTRVEEQLADLSRELQDQVFWFPAEAAWGTQEVAPDLNGLDFLKAGHHGSADATGEAFLRLTKPAAVLFSVGAGNAYGHPSLTTLARIRSVVPGASVWRTDELGDITVTVSRDGTYTIGASRL